MGASLALLRFRNASMPVQPSGVAIAAGQEETRTGGKVAGRLEFGILGPLEVRLGGTLVRVGGPRQRALLALMLCHANQVVSRDQLIDELLSDHPAGSAGRMLRV